MRPAVVYHPDSLPYLDGWKALGDAIHMVDITKYSGKPLADCHAAYMRIGHALKWRVGLDALKVQRHLSSQGVKIVNPLETKLQAERKDVYYRILANDGLRTPTCITMPEANELRFAIEVDALRYPFVLRVVDGLQGKGTRLISGDDDMEQSLREFGVKDRIAACEYIDKPKGSEYFIKWRPYIFGGKVDMWEATISRRWKATVANNLDFRPEDFAAVNAVAKWPLHWNSVAEKCAGQLGLSVCALDMIFDPKDGRPVIVDVNSTYGYQCDKIEREKKITLFDPKVQAIRAGHFRRLADWLGSL